MYRFLGAMHAWLGLFQHVIDESVLLKFGRNRDELAFVSCALLLYLQNVSLPMLIST